MKNSLTCFLTAVFFCAMSTLSSAANANPSMDGIKAALQKRLGPEADIKSVEKASFSFPQLYEVNLGSQIVYTDAAGRYLIAGAILDTNSKENLTEKRLALLNKIEFSDLPLKDAIKVVKGNEKDKGHRKIAVFSDPRCPYCKRFEKETLKDVNNITIYTFLVPILGPASRVKAKAIWCANNNSQAWEDWMVKDKAPSTSAKKGCDESVLDKNLILFQKLNLTGTPAIFLENGHRLTGAVPAVVLEDSLKAVNSKTPSK